MLEDIGKNTTYNTTQHFHLNLDEEVAGEPSRFQHLCNKISAAVAFLLTPITWPCKKIHQLIGMIIVPSVLHCPDDQISSPPNLKSFDEKTSTYIQDEKYIVHTIQVTVDKTTFTAHAIIDKSLQTSTDPSAANRWTLYTPANSELASNRSPIDYLPSSHYLVFDYPGAYNQILKSDNSVDAKAKTPEFSKATLIKAQRTMMRVLEEQIRPSQAIYVGRSLGGGVLGESLSQLMKEKPDGKLFDREIPRIVVKERTFSTLTACINKLIFPGVGLLAAMVGWHFGSSSSSKQLGKRGIHEVIIQDNTDTMIKDGSRLAEDYLGKKESPTPGMRSLPEQNKTIFWTTNIGHNGWIKDTSLKQGDPSIPNLIQGKLDAEQAKIAR